MHSHAIEHIQELSPVETNSGAILAGYWNEAVSLKVARDRESERSRRLATDERTERRAVRYSFD